MRRINYDLYYVARCALGYRQNWSCVLWHTADTAGFETARRQFGHRAPLTALRLQADTNCTSLF